MRDGSAVAIVNAILPDIRAIAMNRLADETSPYLQQHAANPVDWYPWGAAAIARAKAEDRPILLSIGYSACHWCHVMAHESFEDEATAAVMNRLFVNVKVDREERPDLDKVYQIAHQVLTQRGGGWPLTMFLAPDDLTPFFAGTYFPKQARYGMPAFTDLIERVAAFYRDERDSVRSQNAALRGVFDDLVPPVAKEGISPESRAHRSGPGESRSGLRRALRRLRPGAEVPACRFHRAAAARLAGDGGGTRTRSRSARHGDADAPPHGGRRPLRPARRRLLPLLSRPVWMIPHFEKMLYDNGPLLALCAEAAVATGDAVFRDAAVSTADWALREMRSPEGGFYAALDADSEGHEGRFYVWRRDEVESLLAPDEYRVLARRYGLDREPNFEGEWHLHAFVELDRVADELAMPTSQARNLLDSARAKLLSARAQRVRPGLDDKILTSWNALMIRGLAISGRLLAVPAQVDAALAAIDFLRANCWHDGTLLASWKQGTARFPGYLDDYAFLLDALLEALQSRFRVEDLRLACQVADALLSKFADSERGGFWFTAEGEDPPLHRPKGFADEAMPSGNGVAAKALARLGWLTGEMRYLDAAEATIRGGYASLMRSPEAHASMLIALDEYLDPSKSSCCAVRRRNLRPGSPRSRASTRRGAW